MDLKERGDRYEIVIDGEVVGGIKPNSHEGYLLMMYGVQVRVDSLDNAKRWAARYAEIPDEVM